MSTSLYGTVKKIGSSYFTFDKIYNSRDEMENKMTTDGVYHGRYVLVTYGNEQLTNSTNGGTIVLTDNTNVTERYSVSYTRAWLDNYNLDIQHYHNVYDKTVWQKIFDGGNEKYIMVASLNARAPGLTINEDYYSFNLETDTTSTDIFYTKVGSNGTVITHDGSEEIGHGPRQTAHYPLPKWHETYSNELIYHLDMPMPLKINLGKFEYFKNGFSAKKHFTYTTSTDDENYIRWEHILKNSDSTEVVAADFNFNIPRLGEVISDAYDALYGVPYNNGTEQNNANRPFTQLAQDNNSSLKQATKDALSQTNYQGLLYILSKIGLRGEHYYLSSDWGADKNTYGHIDNKPHVISNITVAATGTIGLWTIAAASQDD